MVVSRDRPDGADGRHPENRRPSRSGPGVDSQAPSSGTAMPGLPEPGDGPLTNPGASPQADRESELRRIAAELGAAREADRVLVDALAHARTLFEADAVAVFTIEPNAERYAVAASGGCPPELLEAVVALPRGGGSAGRSAVGSARPRALSGSGGTAEELAMWASVQAAGFGSACLVPVAFLDEALGLLLVCHRTRNPWSTDELDLADAFASQVAQAVQNARLHERVSGFTARLNAIKDLAGRLNGIHDVREIGSAIVAEIRDLYDSDTARVYVVDHATRYCEPVAFGGVFAGVPDPSPDLLRVPLGEGLTGWVAAHDLPLRIADGRLDPRRIVVGPDEEPESMLLAPMTFEGVVRGVVVVTKKGAARYAEDDLTTLTIFAGFAAQALVNAANLATLRTQQRELEQRLAGQRALLDVNSTLLSAQDPNEVLERIADGLKIVVQYDNLTIYRIDREAGVRVAVLARDRYADVILAEKIALDIGLTGWAMGHNEAVCANDAHLDPRAMNIPGTPVEPESLVVVPLLLNGEVAGTLNVGRMGEANAHFSAGEFELIQLFAGQASIALHGAEALQAAEQRAERDALTGLHNHGFFQASLARLLAGSEGRPEAFSLLMLDLDGFKAFNDRYGHPAGDALLRRVGETLASAVRDGDRVFRYGGDEFSVLLRGIGRKDARVIADRLTASVDALTAAENEPRVTVSVGVAACPGDGATKDDLVMLADAELYLEKAARRHARSGRGGATVGRGAEYEAAIQESTFTLLARRDPSELLETIVARAAALAGTPNGYLYLVVPDEGVLRIAVGLGSFAGLDGYTLRRGQGLAGHIWETGEPEVVADYDTWAGHAPGLESAGRIGSVVGVPLRSGTEIVGVIGLASGDSGQVYDETDVAAVARFSRLASVALENARLHAAARTELAARASSEVELRAQGERLRRLVDASFEALVLHRDGRIVEVNQAFVDLFGRLAEEITGTPVLDLFPERVRSALARQLAVDTETPYETAALLADGTEAAVELVARTIPALAGEDPIRATAVRDIRERRAIQERLVRHAFYDPLTGLPNRSLFLDRASHALAWSRPGETAPVATLMLDLDRFKVVNESLGHAVGDQLLAAVGRRFDDAIRPGDTLARLGGDEFAVLLDGLGGEAAARAIAQRLVESLALPFVVDGRDITLGVSVGVAIARGSATNGADLLREAEIALYRAKADTTSRVAVFVPSMSGASLERLEMEGALRRAVERGELRLHYQPLVDLRAGRIVGCEALVRWQHPTRGLLAPAAFIPLAEETGLILGVGDWVLREACRQTRAWQLAHPDRPLLIVSVNLSGRQFGQPDLPATVARALAATGLPASCLELEITETVAMSNAEATGITLRTLRELGVRLVLDDFGTGYSSLAYLSTMPLDIIKVDRAFVSGLADSATDHSIIAAVVALAHGLGIEVTAEGIEREDQLDAVVALACDYGQGYLFSRPLPPTEIEAFMEEPLAGRLPGDRAA